MTGNDKEIWDIVARMLNGDASPEEQNRFESWLKESPGNEEFFRQISGSKSTSPEFTIHARNRIFKTIESRISDSTPVRKINIWKYSAAASLVFIVMFTFYHFFDRVQSNNGHNSFIVTRVPNGAQTRLELPDNSVVYVNSGSEIEYPPVFSGHERKVKLKGEAYFEVTTDQKHPFLVEAGNIMIKVHGTRFNVKNYEESGIIETSLLEGSVEVYLNSGDRKSFMLKPDQKAVFDKSTGIISCGKSDAELESIWKDGRYYFENEKFSLIAARLERHFNVKIIINSPALGDNEFSGLFDNNRTIFQILDVMKEYSRFSYTASKDTIYINQ